MEKRRYSITEIQSITQLTPATLQDFLRRFQKYFSFEMEDGPEGTQIFLDQTSFERLMFIKNLELNQDANPEEAANQLKTLGTPTRPKSEKKNIAATLEHFLDSLTKQIRTLETSLNQILYRYVQVLKDLNQCRSENRFMRKEIDALRHRQEKILVQINQGESQEIAEAKIKKDQLN